MEPIKKFALLIAFGMAVLGLADVTEKPAVGAAHADEAAAAAGPGAQPAKKTLFDGKDEAEW